MKIALAQMDVKAGYPEINFAKMKDMVVEAKVSGVDIIAFPELCVGGYLIGDLHLDDEYCRYLMSFNDRIKDLSEGICIIYGNIYLEEREFISKKIIGGETKLHTRGFDGRKIRYNAAYAYYNKEPLEREYGSDIIPKGIQPKILLPTYRYFDDKRYFYSPINWEEDIRHVEKASPFILPVIKEMKFRIGVQLCEDMWKDDYRDNPAYYIGNSDIIINLSASPWTCGKNKTRDRIVKNLLPWNDKKTTYDQNNNPVEENIHPPYAYVNCVGSQNNGKNIVVFDGATTVYGKDGEPRIFANSNYEEELLIFDVNNIPDKVTERPDEDKIARKSQAIIRGIKHISETSGILKFVVGVSGGVDSDLVVCLLEQAVGADNIIPVNMPSKFNSKKTKNAARTVCKNLGIKVYKTVNIQKIVNTKIKSIFGDVKPTELTIENIQAETRMTILSAIAGNEKALFTCNGNKIETALGYFTINGDGRGAIGPIADLTKKEVYDMADYFNKKIYGKKVIPANVFPDKNYQFVGKNKIQPSAELKDDQVDPIKIGYHCGLIEQIMDYKKIGPNQIMKWWLDKDLHNRLGIELNLMNIYKMDDAHHFISDLNWFIGKIKGSVFKRVQSPPIVILSKSSYGYDHRESILVFNNNYMDPELVEKVLKKEKYE